MKLRQASLVVLFICMAFVWRIVNGWPEVQVRMMVCAGALLALGLGGVAVSKGQESRGARSLRDYLTIAMAVAGGNVWYRVIDGLPLVDVTRAAVAVGLVVGAFVVVLVGSGDR